MGINRINNIKLNILEKQYVFKFFEEDEREDGFYFGECDYIKQEIFINTNKYLTNERIHETLIHEITHAYSFEYTGQNEFEDIQEYLAEFNQRYARKIIEGADKVYNDYIGYIRGDT